MCSDRRLTYAALNAEADAIGGALAARDIKRGDRVALYMENAAETVAGIFATLKAGATFSVLNPSLKPGKLVRILNNFRPTALIVDRRRAGTIADIVAQVPSLQYLLAVSDTLPGELVGSGQAETWTQALGAGYAPPSGCVSDEDLATIIYTSGSTGVPKGVMSAHGNVIAATTSINGYLHNTVSDVIMDVLPLSFDYGLYQLFLAFQAGACVVLEQGFIYPAQVIQRMRKEGVTGFPVVPTMVSLLLHQRRETLDLPALRYVTNTGAALPVAHIARLREALPHVQLFSMYGLTECKRVSYLPPEELDRRPGSIGIAIPNTEVFIVDDEGNPVPRGVAGELVVRGAHVMRGYWEAPEETARRYRPGPLPGETVLYSGDLARMDEDGFLYFIGRKDDIIKSRGEKVSPKEVEAVAYALHGVVDAAVIGLPDPVLGEAVTLIVATAAGSTLTERQIRLHCQQHLEDFMVPRNVQVWPALPKTTPGKIDKLAIRERCETGPTPIPAN